MIWDSRARLAFLISKKCWKRHFLGIKEYNLVYCLYCRAPRSCFIYLHRGTYAYTCTAKKLYVKLCVDWFNLLDLACEMIRIIRRITTRSSIASMVVGSDFNQMARCNVLPRLDFETGPLLKFHSPQQLVCCGIWIWIPRGAVATRAPPDLPVKAMPPRTADHRHPTLAAGVGAAASDLPHDECRPSQCARTHVHSPSCGRISVHVHREELPPSLSRRPKGVGLFCLK